MRRRKQRNGSKGNGVHPATMEKRRRRLLDQQEERS